MNRLWQPFRCHLLWWRRVLVNWLACGLLAGWLLVSGLLVGGLLVGGPLVGRLLVSGPLVGGPL